MAKEYNKMPVIPNLKRRDTSLPIRKQDAKFFRSLAALLGVSNQELFHVVVYPLYKFYTINHAEGTLKNAQDYYDLVKIALNNPIQKQEEQKPEQAQKSAESVSVN